MTSRMDKMLISPIMPYDLKGQIKPELLELAEKVCIESAKIASGYNQHVVNAFRDVLRITNSYYSNRIEAESTHPIDIEKAMLKQFSDDSKEKLFKSFRLPISKHKSLSRVILWSVA